MTSMTDLSNAMKAYVLCCVRLSIDGATLCPVVAWVASRHPSANNGLRKHALGVLPFVKADHVEWEALHTVS